MHEGVYRERVSPPRGGRSDAERIVYQAAPGEKVEIKGSEVVKNWVKVAGDVWKVTLPNSFFGSFNPYNDVLHGDWYISKGRPVHSGAVYLDGQWLTEAAALDEVLKPAGTSPLWFARATRPRPRSGRSSRARTPTSGWRRSMSAARCFIRRSPASTTSPSAALRCGRRPRPGSRHGRADRAVGHALEQGLDHREQPCQPFGLLRYLAGQTQRLRFGPSARVDGRQCFFSRQQALQARVRAAGQAGVRPGDQAGREEGRLVSRIHVRRGLGRQRALSS